MTWRRRFPDQLPTDTHAYQFGPFRLEPATCRLLRDGQLIPLPPKAFDALLVLVRAAPRVVRKEELLQTVWSGVFVQEDSLTKAISALRKALRSDGPGTQFIETVARRGYRFAMPATAIGSGEPTVNRSGRPWTSVLVASALSIAAAAALVVLSGQAWRWHAFAVVEPHWHLFASDGGSTLVNRKLILTTTKDIENRAYMQFLPDSSRLPDPFVVEARLRYVSGASTHPSRTPAAIGLTTAPGVGVVLFVGQDRLFLTRAQRDYGSDIGDIALVDTHDRLHTYRIEIARSGRILVSQDGRPILIGHTYVGPDDHGNVERVLWGEGSSVAHGITEWAFVRHNGGCQTPCRDEVSMAAAGPQAWAPARPWLGVLDEGVTHGILSSLFPLQSNGVLRERLAR